MLRTLGSRGFLSRAARHLPRRWTWSSRACTPRPAPACSRRRSSATRRSPRPTRRRCSRPSTKVWRSGAAGWRPSWRNGRATGPASPAICTARWRRTASRVFHDAASDHGMSDAMRWFIGGQQALMPELLAMVACTVNSYTRLIPGFWAPTDATWGVENRTCALRVIPGSAKSQRVEYRIAAADINPYIALAAAIGSGLWGIENQASSPTSRSTATPMRRSMPAKRAAAAHAVGGGAAAQDFEAGARVVRRRLRRPLCGDPRMGGARVPQGDHRLGVGPLFRNHLIATSRRAAVQAERSGDLR